MDYPKEAGDKFDRLPIQKRDDRRIDRRKDLDLQDKIDSDQNQVQNQNQLQQPGNILNSEFKPETFTDTDFSKQTFQDLFTDMDRPFAKPDYKRPWDKEGKSDDEERLIGTTDDEKRRVDARRRADEFRDDFRDLPKPDLLGDWVPDKPDPLANGAFAVSPDNGSPVPYRLNGHVNWERSFPWDIGD